MSGPKSSWLRRFGSGKRQPRVHGSPRGTAALADRFIALTTRTVPRLSVPAVLHTLEARPASSLCSAKQTFGTKWQQAYGGPLSGFEQVWVYEFVAGIFRSFLSA